LPIKPGWEVSSDRVEKLEKLTGDFPIGDLIITSKCKLDKENGLLLVSDNGFAWRIQAGFKRGMYSIGKDKWVRWCDVANIIQKKNGVAIVELKIRKKGGALIIDKKSNPKIKKWKLTMQRNKEEESSHFKERLQSFNNIMLEIFNRNKVTTDPPTSDSKM